MRSPFLGSLVSLAAQQHGLFSADQADALGVDPQRRHRGVQSGLLKRVHPSVYLFATTELTWSGAALAAVLQSGSGATASHESAFWLHGLGRLVDFAPVVSLPPGGRAAQVGYRVHRYCDLVDEHRCEIDGVPTTTLARAVVDTTSVLSMGRLAWLVDELMIRERLLTVGEIGRCLRQVNRRGRRRIRNLQAVLDERLPGGFVPRSRLERHVDEMIRSSRLPRPAVEFPVPGWTRGPGFVDRAWPDAKLILEVDGRPWHARESSMAQDRARDRAAAAAGWQTLRVLDEEIANVGAGVIADLERAYAVRLALRT
jgi:very-short-patch-repair endonuclease